LGLAVISYDPVEIHAAFSRQHNITFPLLADVGSETIKAYGILNTVTEEALGPNGDDPDVQRDVQTYVSAVNPGERMLGIAFPGTFVLDPEGRVTSRFFEDFYRERNTVSNLLVKLGVDAEPVEATRVSSAYLDITTHPSDATVALGNRFTLILDLEPGSGMHVYAPGAEGYRVITLNLDPQPYLRPLAITYPESEIYHFVPLDERVPVYREPFTLLQEIVLEVQPEDQKLLEGQESVTVSGTLEYQACDDTVCYNPVSVPLSWTMSLRSLVRLRPQPQ